MAHFAKLDGNNLVTQVIVVSNDDTSDETGTEYEAIGVGFCQKLLGGTTTWKQTSMMNGANAVLAVKTDGSLWSWGTGNLDYGLLGLNDTVNYSSPMQVGTDTNWSEPLSDTGGSAGALRTDDTLWVWGDQAYGALGLNNNIKYSSPVQLPGKWKNTAGGGADGIVGLQYSS